MVCFSVALCLIHDWPGEEGMWMTAESRGLWYPGGRLPAISLLSLGTRWGCSPCLPEDTWPRALLEAVM